MTTLIASGMTLRLGSGAIIQGGSVQAPPAYVTFSDTRYVSRYAGDGTSTPVWTTVVSPTHQGLSLGVDLNNQKIFAATQDGILTKLDAATGAVDWTVDIGYESHGPRIAVDENGHAYVGFHDGANARATKKINGSNANTIWSSSTSYTFAYSTIYSQAQNAVYVCHEDQTNWASLVKYNASTGVEIWKKGRDDVLEAGTGYQASSYDGVLLPDGNIALTAAGYSGSGNKGYFFVLNASTGAQIVKQTMDSDHRLGNIVADSTYVYLSTNEHLYAFEHDGTNKVANTSFTSKKSMGYRASKDQAYLANTNSSGLFSMNATSTGINFGPSIGDDGRNGGGWPILFLD